MRILIVSDTHRKNEKYFQVVFKEKPLDLVLHCGDAEGAEYTISESAECPVEIVLGNNDFFSNLPKEIEMQIGKYKALITHGHNYYVSMGNEKIKKEALARGCNMVIYGHTHRPVIDITKDIVALNPGSLSYPRQEGKQSSYILMEVDEQGEIRCQIKYL